MDEYVKSSIAYAFIGAWEAIRHLMLANFREDHDGDCYQITVSGLQANIKTSRVYIWLAFNLMFTLFGILHIILQSRSSHPVVIDTAAVALTTDVSKLLDDDDVKKLKWKNICFVTNRDASTYDERNKPTERILLKLERGENGFALARKND